MTERANILLVDDKPSRLLTYEAILERLDQNLVRAHSGEEALERLQEGEFAAILLDVSMPGMNGFETAEAIRGSALYGSTPIIFVTGVHITDFDRLRGYEMGAADYVYVPVVPEILRGKVQVLVQLFEQRRELARLNQRLAAANRDLAEAHARLQAENTRELQKLNSTLELANTQLVSEIAERKRAEALLKESARRKDEFISILAHELRNPLAAMQSGIELLAGKDLPRSRLPWARDLLQRQLKVLTRLIDDLLDVSRVTSGRVRLKREALELRSVIEQCVDSVRPLLDEKEHALEVSLPSEPVYVDGDPVRLAQVFGNLLTNAAKYTRASGRITLAARIVPGSPPWIEVHVTDNGEGISSDMLERVFELFTQVHTSESRAQTGLGIGLALVRGLVELHGGEVSASSDGPGSGARFAVRLPLREVPPEHATPAEPEPAVETAPMRLLIIDDNVDLANGLAVYLTDTCGHQVRIAHSGRDGIDQALAFDPDAILLDVGLPDIDGCEVARRLREEHGLDAALIGLSGFSGEADRDRAMRAGMHRYLIKPVPYAALSAALAEEAATRASPSSGCRAEGMRG